ncbi:hypothetical protein DH86_00000354 [Scytalidium sp. 3C]|nr:hypothetical protein DH86_00000354 [Scytalidium sp. 3C]
MSTLKQSGLAIVAYYVIIFGGRELMKNRPAFKLNGLFMIHNLYLTLISGGLLALFLEQLIPEVTRNGVFHAICHKDGGWTPQLVILYYLVGLTAVSWVPITLNLTVHVVMYWYYFQSARGIRIWWKEWITRLQIIQFVIDLGFVYFASWTYFTSTYFPWLPNSGSCAGEEFAAFAGIGILSSYLLLFISFYFATYKKDGKRPTGRKAARSLKDAELPDVAALTNGKINPVRNGTANGSTNGSANGSANGHATSTATPGRPVTRSRKA